MQQQSFIKSKSPKFKSIHFHENYSKYIVGMLQDLANKKCNNQKIAEILQRFYFFSSTSRTDVHNQKEYQPYFKQLIKNYGQQLPDIFSQTAQFMLKHPKLQFRILQKNRNDELTLTKAQVCYLVCAMTLNLVPKQTYQSNNFPWPHNFAMIFQQQTFKTKAIIQYLKHFFKETIHNEKELQEKMSIRRQVVNKSLNVIMKQRGNNKMMKFKVLSNQTSIQDYYQDIKVDFANKYIGGGVLGRGCVQEEIMFGNRPEILTSLLFCQKMKSNQSLFFTGFKKYSKNTGYGWSTQYDGQQNKFKYQYDSQNRAKQYITAIDALQFYEENSEDQFEIRNIDRQIMKAFSGFNVPEQKRIITGNWGCGAFNGDVRTKFLIQWIACSLANKEMMYCPYGSQKIILQNQQILKQLQQKKVQQVYELFVQKACNMQNPKSNIIREMQKSKGNRSWWKDIIGCSCVISLAAWIVSKGRK